MSRRAQRIRVELGNYTKSSWDHRNKGYFHLLKNIFVIPPAGFKGNLWLLEIYYYYFYLFIFEGAFSQMEG